MSTAAETGWLGRLLGVIWGRHRASLCIAIGASLLGSVGQAVVPLIARHVVDEVIIAGTSPLWPWILALVAAAMAVFALTYLRRYRGGRVAVAVQYDLRNAIHDHLLTLDQHALGRMPTGQLVARANSDSALVQALLMFLPMLSGNILLMITSLVIMFVLAPWLALVGVVVLPALFVISYRMRVQVFPASWDGQQREGDVAQIVDEAVSGVRVVKAFGQERRELQRVADAAQSLYGARMRTVRLQSRFQPLMETVPVIAQVAILAVGGWLALHGNLSIGTFLAFSTYVAQFAGPARMLANILTVGQQARAGAERIFQLLDTEPAIADADDAAELPPARGEIVFRDVSYTFPDGDTAVLDGFELTVAPGERVAIVGSSGSGKSTVAGMVTRFQDPVSGAVTIDGHDLRDVTLSSLRRQIAVAFEDPFLFSDTVLANIAYGRPEATRAEIEAAAQAARAHDFITDLPKGYDTAVGERGLTLSGGQRQRIALARAILARPAILILDDATSAVDARTEEAIHDALRDVLAERTTLLIAHRLSTLRLADRVVVLADGRLDDTGTHEELMERSPAYRALLSGLEEKPATDIESLAEVAAAGGVTASAWDASAAKRSGSGSYAARIGAPSLGAGLGGSAGGGWRTALAPTPELMARVEALPAVRDVADVDVATESQPMDHFSLRTLLRQFRRPLAIGLALVVLDAMIGLLGPILVRIGIDDGVAKGAGHVLLVATAVFALITVVDFFTQMGETFVTGRAAERIMLSLRIRIWAQLQRLSLDYYEREMGGRIMTRMTTDVDQFESLVENGLLNALVAFATFVGVGVALLVINPILGLCVLSVMIPLALATYFFRRLSGRLYDVARDRISIVNADFQESLSGIREAQTFVHEGATVKRFHRLGRDYVESRVAAQRLIALYFPFVQLLSAVADAIVLGVGARLITTGHMTEGTLIAFILYIDMFFSPIQQLSQVFDAWQQTRVSVGRIAQLMSLHTLTPEPVDPVATGRLTGATDLDDVHFHYPTATAPVDGARVPEALRGVDFDVIAGQTVALVGETGAGKSTVMKMVARFYDPDRGAVRMDRHDLRTVDLHDFRTQLGYVPQESFLFSGSVRDNIAYGRPGATDAEVEAAARAVGAHDFIAGLSGGYLHELAERGRSLSAGQRQLLALARAELVDPAILLLDEATSNLDLVTEAHVSAAMRQLTSHRTTILIAHRLQTARAADQIIVLDHGAVAEVGSHDELLDAGGRYAAMWRAFDTASAGDPARSRASLEPR
ncbi:MAG: ABC transporter ATP-binding protein/permease [Nocardioidaceae bacterium]|nr:ABC transporter ATP-binding protein/permease [Nocardioidaceae bacterium]